MTVLRVASLDLVYLLVGTSVLYGLGLVRSWRAGLRYGCLALLAGWALLGVAGSFALVAGSSLGLATLLVLALVLAAAGLVGGRRVRPAAPAPGWQATPLRLVAGVAAVAVVSSVLLDLLRYARLLAGASQWDAWAFWIPKAEAIVYRGGIGTGPGSFSSFANPDYPPFVPAADSMVFRFAGKVDPGLLGVQHWVLAAAFFGALAGLLWHRVAPELLLPSLAVLAVTPAFDHSVASLLAEDSLTIALGLAAAAGALWLLEREPRHAALYAVFAAAVSLIKNEGFYFALLLAVLLAAVAAREGHRRVAALALAAPLAAMLPWKLWLAVNHVPANPYYSPLDFVRPSRTLEQLGRLRTTLSRLPGYYVHLDRSLVVVPVLAVLVALALRRRPRLALYTVGFLVVAFLGNVAVYWVSDAPLRWYIETSAGRTSTGPIVFAAVLLPILASELVSSRRQAAVPLRAWLRRLLGRRVETRLVAAVALLVYFLAVVANGGDRTWGSFQVPAIFPGFEDARSVTAAWDCVRRGIHVLPADPCDPLGRPYYHPRLWLLPAHLGAGSGLSVVFGMSVVALFLVAALWLAGHGQALWEALVWAAALVSPAVMLGVERGNPDLLIFALLALSAALLVRSRPLGAAALLVTAMLKLYPAAAFIALLLRPRRRALAALGAISLAFAAYVAVTFTDIRALAKALPTEAAYSFGARVAADLIGHAVGISGSALAVVGLPRLVIAAILATLWLSEPLSGWNPRYPFEEIANWFLFSYLAAGLAVVLRPSVAAVYGAVRRFGPELR